MPLDLCDMAGVRAHGDLSRMSKLIFKNPCRENCSYDRRMNIWCMCVSKIPYSDLDYIAIRFYPLSQVLVRLSGSTAPSNCNVPCTHFSVFQQCISDKCIYREKTHTRTVMYLTLFF